MNRYEMGVVVRADLEEDGFRAEMERVKALIDRFGGTIEKVDEWGRRKLAYPIAKLTEGMYTFITYSSEGPTPREVESRLRLMENVLRFLTIRKDETELIPAVAARPEDSAKPPESPEPVKAKPVAEPATEPATEPVAEPVAEPAAEPVVEPATEPTAAEPTAEPVVEPAAAEPAAVEPAAEPAAEPAE